jgi:hypothetical protein
MTIAEPLYAVQHIRRMRGGSQAHLIRASDNSFYITKFQNNPQHVRVLASEYLGSRLGAFLGLPMPEVKVMDVPEWLITNTPDLRIETGGASILCAAGLQLASRYVANPERDHIFDYLPASMFEKVANPEDFPRVLAFDKWTCNSDGRQAIFVKHRRAHLYRAVFIDQGYCFNGGEWTFPDRALRGIYSHNCAYTGVSGWKSFEPVLSRIEAVGLADLREIAAEIPQQWYGHDLAGISTLVEELHKRRTLVRDQITTFRKSTRNPFPNWTG